MIKKKTLNRLGAGALSLMMAFSGIATLAGTVVDSGNPNAGTNGHSTFSWYPNPTQVKDVYKVSMEMDVYVQPTKAEIVLVLDNSGSMGRPYDLSLGVWEGAGQSKLQKLDVDGKPYFIPKNAYTHREGTAGPVTVMSGASTSYLGAPYPISFMLVSGLPGAMPPTSLLGSAYTIPMNFPGRTTAFAGSNDWMPQGAYNGGVQGRQYDDILDLGAVPPAGFKFRNYRDYDVEPYRLEWVRTATAKVLDELLLEENNPLNYDQIKISIVAFGGARTDINSTYNPLFWYPGDTGYNHDTLPVEPPFDVTGGGALDLAAVTSVSNAITYESKWIDNKNVKEEKDKFLNGYIRRSEDTFVAAGLETAMHKLDALKTDFSLTEDWAPENRHVFILADGGDNSTADMSASGSTSLVWAKDMGLTFPQRVDPTRTLAAAAKLKNPKEYNAKISTVGVLETGQHNQGGTVGDASYLKVYSGSAMPSSNSFAERHLLLLAAPLNASAKQFQTGGGYHNNAITGTGGSTELLYSDEDDDAMFYEYLKADTNNAYLTFSNTGGDGYGEFSKDTVANLAPGYGPKTTGYTYAENEQKVFEAFSDFTAQFKQSASDIRVRQKLTNMFEVYQMPGEPLYEASNGTVKVSGRDIEWNIDAVSAKGGKVTLTYYIKFDSANADLSSYYSIAEFTSVTWKALGGKMAQSNFPSVIINGNTSGSGWTIDNTGMNAIGDSQASTIGTTGNVLSDMGSSNAAITGTGTTTTQGSGGGVAFLGAGPTVYTASVANTSAAAKKKTKAAVSNGVETLSDSEYKAVKGQSLKIKSSKAAVYEESKKDAKALLYLNKGKTFKITGATESYYMIQYKKKDGKIQKGYILKSDVSLIK